MPIGCPTVGVRTGASFVRHGATGYVVERLPPGQSCVETDGHRASLEIYLDAIRRAQELDRRLVRQHATVDFDSLQIADAVINTLEAVRVLNPGMAGRSNLIGTAVY